MLIPLLDTPEVGDAVGLDDERIRVRVPDDRGEVRRADEGHGVRFLRTLL